MSSTDNCDDCDGCSHCCPPDEGNDDTGGHVDNHRIIAELVKRGFEHVGGGMFREAYMRKGVVIKVPHNRDGYVDNRTEAAAWRKYRNKPTSLGVYLAPCRLLPNGCLMMRAVDTERPNYSSLPTWAQSIDCSQVGFYKGRLVAYDYALDIMEREEWEMNWGTASNFFHEHRLPYLRKKSAA